MSHGRFLVALGVCAGLATVAEAALACGGTFCDRPANPGSPPMPVDQSGENVVFVLTGGRVEAHVQIQYEGDPERFAWVIPVPAKPDVTVGSQRMFVELLNATVPTYSRTTTTEFCSSNGDVVGSRSSSSGAGCGASDTSGRSYNLGGGTPSSESVFVENSDTVVLRQSVGSFDVTILEPSTPDEVTTWLDDNDFLVEPDALPILTDYVDRDHLFVALRLNAGAGIDEIHPLVFSYEGTEPCIPLKLTAVAATENMSVRALFLGDQPVVPTTYRHVVLNEALLDWRNPGSNYTGVVSMAVDSPGASGRAFVTEYAGTSRVVDTSSLADGRWNADAFRTIEPTTVIDELESQGLVDCSTGSCSATHPLVPGVLSKYLPAPGGVAERDFYACLTCYADDIDAAAWDGDAFANEIETLVVAPGNRAVEIIESSSTLTRLFTTISPSEMTEDPMFAEDPTAPNVVANHIARETVDCQGRSSTQLENGRTIASGRAGSPWPSFPSMSAAETIFEHSPSGETIVLANEVDSIDDEIRAHNDREGFPYPPSTNAGVTGGPNGFGNRGSSNAGCGCRTHFERAGQGYALALFALAWFARRRRSAATIVPRRSPPGKATSLRRR